MNNFATIETLIADYRRVPVRRLLAEIGEAVVNNEGYLMFLKEPTTFNEIFAVAQTHGLTLNSFSQGRKDPKFFANWRVGDECFDIGSHERPFEAILAALKIAVAAIDARAKPAAPADEMSIFD